MLVQPITVAELRQVGHAIAPARTNRKRLARHRRRKSRSRDELRKQQTSGVINEQGGIPQRHQIIPWNFPLLMACWKLAPALAAGNCVVLKPAEQSSASIIAWAEIIADILPPGVLNIVNGTCPSRALVHADIYDRFMERALKRVAAIKRGDPHDATTMTGAQHPASNSQKSSPTSISASMRAPRCSPAVDVPSFRAISPAASTSSRPCSRATTSSASSDRVFGEGGAISAPSPSECRNWRCPQFLIRSRICACGRAHRFVARSAPKIFQYFDHVAVRHNEWRVMPPRCFRARLTWVREGESFL